MHISKNWKSHHVINHLTFTSYMSLILLPCVHFVTGRWDLLRSTALILWVNHEVVDLSGNKPLYLISATWWNLCETPAEFEHRMNSKKNNHTILWQTERIVVWTELSGKWFLTCMTVFTHMATLTPQSLPLFRKKKTLWAVTCISLSLFCATVFSLGS